MQATKNDVLGVFMRRSGFLMAAIAAAALALAPSLADARAGGGSSMGSRGARTYSAPPSTNTAPSGAQQMQRSATPPPSAMPAGGAAQPARGGLLGGLAGGLLMGGLIGAMFGGSLFGAGFAGFLGALLQFALIGFLIMFVLRLFRRPRLATASGPAMFAPPGAQGMGTAPLNRAGGPSPSGPPVQVTPADFAAFEANLKAVQAAWTSQSLPDLQRLTTMEMLGYFETQFAQQARAGVRNAVSDVKLLQGDLAEAWSEQGREYATVAMRFGMIDVTRDAAGRVVDGNPTQPTQATELWTFVRAPGGSWMLSAIQQTK